MAYGEENVGKGDFVPIPVPEADHYELSPSQRRIWLSNQMEKSSVAYNMPFAYRLDGELRRETPRRHQDHDTNPPPLICGAKRFMLVAGYDSPVHDATSGHAEAGHLAGHVAIDRPPLTFPSRLQVPFEPFSHHN